MPRKATGSIIEHVGVDGLTYRSLRFRALGKRRTQPLGIVSAEDAQRELRHVLADVERGAWRPPEPDPVAVEPAAPLTFHEFAEAWWLEHKLDLAPNTVLDYEWRLQNHLLPHFAAMTLPSINVTAVDAYRAAKLRESKPLCGSSINKTLVTLGAILDVAAERGHIAANPLRVNPRKRKVRVVKPPHTYLDTAQQIEALLTAAGQLDGEARPDRRHVNRRALVATLLFAGLRIGELLDLRWRDVDLAAGRLRVGKAKTDAGRRDVKLRPALAAELRALKAAAPKYRVKADAYVFASKTGGKLNACNVRDRILGRAVTRADELLEEAEATPLPKGLTPHSLRRTFASVLYALGEQPVVVMVEMGHTDPALALRIYAQAMSRDDGQVEQLRTLVNGADWANNGRTGGDGVPAGPAAVAA